ncbi:hypothetical protein KA478_04025 [Patescibacteria group bacterium]|nr:hypothetical protein [Patescibacteria group bacterium]
MEFYFLITNGEDFLSLQESGTGTHSHEIAEILWTDITKDDITLLPDFIKPMLR